MIRVNAIPNSAAAKSYDDAPDYYLEGREEPALWFGEAEPSDPRAVEALAFIRTLYAIEKELRVERARLGERFT